MERDITLITSENIFPDGKMEHDLNGEAMPSLLLSPSNVDEKVHSRYLKPSMPSCHDYCKNGKKHDSEATNRRAFLKKKFRERQQDQVATPCVEERKTRTIIKEKMETESRPESIFSDKSDFSKRRSPSPLKKNITPAEKKTLRESGDSKQNRVKNLNQDHEKKEVIKRSPRQPKSYPDKHNFINVPSAREGGYGYPAIIKEDSESSVSEPTSSIALKEIKSDGSEAGDFGNHGITMENTKSFVSELTTPATPVVMNQKTPPSSKQTQKIKQKAYFPHKNVDVAGRSAIVLKTKGPLIRSLSRRKSSRNLIAQRIQTKPPLIRSLSRRKSSQSLMAQRIQERKITQSVGTSRFGGVASKSADTMKSKASLLRSISKLKSSIGQFARRNQEKSTESPSLSEIGEDTAAPADTLRTEIPAVRSVSRLKPSWNPRAQRNRESEINKSLNTSNVTERKLSQAPPPASSDRVLSLKLRKLSSLNRTASLKRSKDKVGRINSKKKSENTVSGTSYKNADSEFATSDLNSVEIEGDNNVEISKGQGKREARRTSTARPEDNISTPYRLKFRQGKVIDLRSDSIGARRLWFKIGKMAAENPSSSSLSWRRSFKKKEDMDSSDSNLPNSEAQIVVLKPQEVRKTKEAQAKLNNRSLSWRRSSFKKKRDVGSPDSNLINSEAQIVVLKHREVEKTKEAQVKLNTRSLSWRRSSFKKKKDTGSSDSNVPDSEAQIVVLKHQDTEKKEAQAKPNISRLSWRRSFKKKKDMGSSDSNLLNSEAQIVVLKHQDVGKKEVQALFNHVIEATASKLVETRKSKVKALVGAFESVISLQESKTT